MVLPIQHHSDIGQRNAQCWEQGQFGVTRDGQRCAGLLIESRCRDVQYGCFVSQQGYQRHSQD